MPKHYRPPGKKKEGNVAKYITRNKAINRLQIKLPEFRRLCILKGIHPREPKKKFEGHSKTYYHVKDINFLLHEPLLDKGRALKAHAKKVKKAKAKKNADLAERLESRRPSYSLDHLVKERYPSFIDALRDMDDPLTMLHLFAVLPADSTHKIPVHVVQTARRLSLEFQAFVTRVHALRKVFVAVKGIYYQAEVGGQKITWLTPHVLSQILPDDVDFRVMLTFIEFYETLAGFINFKLYHDLGLQYPPLLNSKLEADAAELYGVMKDLAAEHPVAADVGELDQSVDVPSEVLPKDVSPEERERRIVESQERLASLQNKLSAIEDKQSKLEPGESGDMEIEKDDEAETINEDEDVDTRTCRMLFKGLKFFLGREVPRESLLFVIRAFGGDVSWDGLGAPFLESDEDISFQVVDRPSQGHMFLSRTYIQPQWVYDSANARLLLPTVQYLLGQIPPPHLSPFADNDAEGYLPEYAKTIKQLKTASEKHVLPLPGTENDINDTQELEAAAAIHRSSLVEAAKELETAAAEAAYMEDLTKEIAGVRYSESLQAGRKETEADMSEEEEASPARTQSNPSHTTAVNEELAMAQVMMPRKTRKLYEAMQMGKAKKKASIDLLKERKRKVEENQQPVKKRKGQKS